MTLATHGVECLLVERREELSSHPRATVVSTRTMELLRSWGLEDEISAGGDPVEWLLWQCETLAQAAAGCALPVGYPTREQSAVISPTAPACVPQDHLGSVLLSHVRALDAARVELATELLGFQPRADRVLATRPRPQDGTRRQVHARFLVAADGAYSAVRTAIGIPMHGP